MRRPGRRPAEEGGLDRRRAARLIAEIVDDKKGEEIVALDVGDLVFLYTDYLVVAMARNERQAKAIVDEVRLRLKRDEGRLPARAEGESEARWVLLDYLDCVLHVQVPEVRERYRLERLWGEADPLDLGLHGATVSAASVRRRA